MLTTLATGSKLQTAFVFHEFGIGFLMLRHWTGQVG